MSSKRFQQRVYCTILRLHPAPFRERFSDEMLWIFDETVGEVGMVHLVVDALHSVWKQRLAEDTVPQFASIPFRTLPASSLSFSKLAQATVLASLGVLGFFALLQQSVPLPQQPRTFAVRRAVFDFCGSTRSSIMEAPGRRLVRDVLKVRNRSKLEPGSVVSGAR